jgi:hypothetical protein
MEKSKSMSAEYLNGRRIRCMGRRANCEMTEMQQREVNT